MKIHVAIALGLIGGLAFGLVAAVTGSPALRDAAEALTPLGTAFVNLLRMVVIPLVVATLFVGVARLGDLKKLTRLGALTLLFFAATTLVSILIGMGTMRLMLPLANEQAAAAVGMARAAGVGAGTGEVPTLPGPIDFLLGLIPANPFQAATEGALLPLIVFTSLFAAAVAALEATDRDRVLDLAEPIAAALIKLVHWILWTAPVGVFALAAPVTAQSGWSMLQSLGVFVLAVLIALVIFVAAVYVPVARFLGGIGPGAFLKACIGSQILGFTTTSSAATIPAMLESTDELGVSRTVSSFVIALGAAIGRAGSALFQGAAIVFLAWLYQTPIPAAGLGVAVLATGLVSITVAGVPSGSIFSLAPALGTVGVPLDGLAVLLGVDRIPDMARSATNVTGTITAAVVMDRSDFG
jgi:Na+/H+-dicarboxylate symporter